MDYTKDTFATDVTTARAAYGALSDAQQGQVTNLPLLVAAEAGVVTDEASLTTAIANASKIFIKNSFTLTAPVVIDKKVSINGNKQTLIGPAVITGATYNTTVVILANDAEVSNLTVNAASAAPGTWVTPARFGMQVYDATGVKLTNITLKNGQAGLLVNAATKDASVVANGIHTVGNGFGGIEVFAATSKTATFTTDAAGNTHTDLVNIAPIWSDGLGTKTVNATGYTAGAIVNNKTHYTKN